LILFCDRGCPFAHRVHALVEHLGCDLDVRESAIGQKPAGLDRYSASERIPLLVDGDLVLTESRVILEHLAERFELPEAYPAQLGRRSLHRHAMAVVDDFLVPRLFELAPVREDEPRLRDVLDTLEAGTATTPPRLDLLTFHVTPIWLRFGSWHPAGVITRAIEARPSLRQWLDDAAALDCLRRTAPDPITEAEDLARARQAGLLPEPPRVHA
jgi:glutathione S-transferase